MKRSFCSPATAQQCTYVAIYATKTLVSLHIVGNKTFLLGSLSILVASMFIATLKNLFFSKVKKS